MLNRITSEKNKDLLRTFTVTVKALYEKKMVAMLTRF